MISIQSIVLIALAYLCLLFFIAYLGDSEWFQKRSFIKSNLVYALSLAVYCSSWTFYGGVGTAAVEGLDYLAIYLGPFIVFVAGYPVIRRVILICKKSNITSISDFISSRYGKSRHIGVLVTLIAVFGSLPYIALQLKAVSASYTVLQDYSALNLTSNTNVSADSIALYTGIILALFAILFGTRHLDSTEHHRGMVLAIAFESIVKLLAILFIGYYAIYLLLDTGHHENFTQFVTSSSLATTFESTSSTWISFATKTFLSMSAIILLPRQFQVMVVESLDHRQFKTAAWMMPIYFMLTSIIVIPIALAGSALLPGTEEDLYVLTLPLYAGNELLSVIAFIGGLSAATGMVIVSVISLSTMVCNDLVMPHLIRSKSLNILNSGKLNSLILLIRRLAIIIMIAGAYGYYKLIDNNAQLANIGILSFAAFFQFVPAFICSLFWRKAHSRGVFWGLIGGTVVWVHTLMIPTLLGSEMTAQYFANSDWFHPQALFGFGLDNPLTHGVVWSLFINLSLIAFFSFREEQSMLEKLQASRFFHIDDHHSSKRAFDSGLIESDTSSLEFVNNLDRVPVHPDSLRILAERIIGKVNTQKVFSEYELRTGINLETENEVDKTLLSRVQTAIVGVIGASSAQKVISDTLLGGEEYLGEGASIVDEASTVLQFNRNLLQTTLQNITQGIAVVDGDLNLVIWNDPYLRLFNYPENLIFVGKPIQEILEYNASRGDFQTKDAEEEIRKRLRRLTSKKGYQSIRTRSNGMVIKSVGEPMPGGGFVTTYEDITDTVLASEQLREANEELENRVKERTKELEILTEELESNTRSKTHFLAAASHDLLQPINAARLFSHSVLERCEHPEDVAKFARRIDQSLATANELLRALLDISKLDAGGIKPNPSEFLLQDFIDGVLRDFEPSASSRNISLLVKPVPKIWVQTDRELLLSVMQNFVTNAIRYTEEGGNVTVEVLVVEQLSPKFLNAEQSESEKLYADLSLLDQIHLNNSAREIAVISVTDTGVGIAAKDMQRIFNEFFQVKSDNPSQKDSYGGNNGLGLGLSIVDRISRLLDLRVSVDSHLGKGATFSIDVPIVERSFKLENIESGSSFVSIGQRLEGVSVLCVDNEDSVLEAMHVLLKGWGCETVSVSGYHEAIEELNVKCFQIVLVDYRLDFEKTGLDLLSVIRETYDADETKGILITAEQDTNLKDKALQLDFQYLAKPVEPAALKSLMSYLASNLRDKEKG